MRGRRGMDTLKLVNAQPVIAGSLAAVQIRKVCSWSVSSPAPRAIIIRALTEYGICPAPRTCLWRGSVGYNPFGTLN